MTNKNQDDRHAARPDSSAVYATWLPTYFSWRVSIALNNFGQFLHCGLPRVLFVRKKIPEQSPLRYRLILGFSEAPGVDALVDVQREILVIEGTRWKGTE
ncbi:MAG TPA: hypothetical protein VGB89_12965 [Bacteroidota bacterium]